MNSEQMKKFRPSIFGFIIIALVIAGIFSNATILAVNPIQIIGTSF